MQISRDSWNRWRATAREPKLGNVYHKAEVDGGTRGSSVGTFERLEFSRRCSKDDEKELLTRRTRG